MRKLQVLPKPSTALCLLASACVYLTGCAASRGVRPVGAGHLVAGASVGGPIFNNLAVPVVAPLTTLFARLGVAARTDLDMGVMLPVGRVVGIDAGAAHLILAGAGAVPYVMLGARASLLGNARSWVQHDDINTQSALGLAPQLFEEAYVNASWDLTRRTLGFVGTDVFAQVQRASYRPSLVAGVIWRSASGVNLQGQVNWLAVHRASDMLSVRYMTLAGLGSVGLQFSLAYDFGRLATKRAPK